METQKKRRKNGRRIVLTILVFIILLFFGYIFLHKLSISNTGSGHHSDSEYQAKQDGFFIADYVPNKKECSLKFRKGRFTIDTFWVQYPWHWEPNSFVTTKERLDDNKYYCFCVKLNLVDMNFLAFSFGFESTKIGESSSYDMDGIYSGNLYQLPDTLRVFVIEKKNSKRLQNSKQFVTDTITFFRSRN